jgi:hypothetical protein
MYSVPTGEMSLTPQPLPYQHISQMDQTTQQNPAQVEEAATVSQPLDAQAAKLAQAVAVFKLDASSMCMQ